MKKSLFIAFLISIVSLWAQDEKKFDRGKWQELKGKIKYEKSVQFPPPNADEGSGDGNGIGSGGFGREGDEGTTRRRRRNTSQDSDSSVSGGMGNLAYILLVIVAIVLVALLVYFFVFKNKGNPESENTEIEDDLEEIDIHSIEKSDLELALEKALKAEDYRKCIRIYFTFILKELSTTGRIQWEKEKTNYDYLRELDDQKEFHGFRNAMEVFEIIWYGKRNISKTIYQQLEPDFKNYLEQLSTE